MVCIVSFVCLSLMILALCYNSILAIFLLSVVFFVNLSIDISVFY